MNGTFQIREESVNLLNEGLPQTSLPIAERKIHTGFVHTNILGVQMPFSKKLHKFFLFFFETFHN